MAWANNNNPRSKVHRARVARIRADNLACQIRGPRCTGRATTSDHILALALGGTDTDDNTQPACQACNEWKAALEGAQARAQRRAEAKHPNETHPARRRWGGTPPPTPKHRRR